MDHLFEFLCWLIAAAALVVAVRALLRRDGVRSVGADRGEASSNRVFNAGPYGHPADESWESFLRADAAEKGFQTYRGIFCDNGIFYYLQRFAAYGPLLSRGVPFDEAKELFRYWIVNNLRNFLGARCRCVPGGYLIDETGRPDIDRQTYLLNLGIRDEAFLTAENVRMLRRMEQEDRARQAEIENRPNNRLFRALWSDLQPCFERLFTFDREELDTIGDSGRLQARTARLYADFADVLRARNLEFRFASDMTHTEAEEAFLGIGSDEELPALVRTTDGHVYLKGVHAGV